MSSTAGHEVLAALDRLLADQPEKVGDDFSAATRHLAAWRYALAQCWRHSRAERDRYALERVNAALSVILGGQFPLGQVPWPEIQKVRQDLADLVTGEADQPATETGSSSHTTWS
jgi:formate dehydrogenase major subunit